MIGIDTNVLVRAFARDDDAQAQRAIRLLDRECAPGSAFVNVVVLVEFAWTMRRAYKWDEEHVRMAVNAVVRHPALTVQHREQVLAAISNVDGEAGSFADRLIAVLNLAAGCDATLTFDKEAARSNGFRELSL